MSGREDKPKLTVPKFSSFKPKQPELPAPAGKDGQDDERADRKRHRHSRHDEHRSKRLRQGSDQDDRHGQSRRSETDRESATRQAKEDGERRRVRSRSPGSKSESRRPTQTARAPPVKSDHFFFDVKGDPLILKYGGIERSKIPAYRRYGHGRVLGTPGRLIIHRDGARDQFSLVMPGESAAFKDKDGLHSKSSRSRRNPVLLRARKEGVAEADDDGYIAIGSSKESRRPSDSDSDSADADAKPDYRSIEGKAKPTTGGALSFDSDPDESGSEDELPPLDQSNPLKWRSIQLGRRVKDHPEDTAAWIELADHQDDLLRAGEALDHQVLDSEAHSYAEIKVSMLEKALVHASDPQLRLQSLIYLMREGMKVWNTKTATNRWSEVLKDEGGDNFDLWRLYLDFSMSNIASFRVEEIKTLTLDRLSRLIAKPESDPSQTFGQAIYLFLRVTKFLHDAGYRELAVATWQAMLEMTFFRPSGLDAPKAAMEAFEKFWESEAPRIGEPNASGWKQFAASPGDAPDPVEYSRPEFEETKDSYKAWANEERWQAQRASLPARTLDQGNDEDPFRVIMFSDISPLLFLIPDAWLPQLGLQLLNGFLIFSGLAPLPAVDQWTTTALQDPFITDFEDLSSSHKRQDGVDDLEVAKRMPNFSPTLLHVAATPELLFPAPGNGWYQSLHAAGQHTSSEVELAHQVFRQLVRARVPVAEEDVALYYMSLSSIQEPSAIKKIARNLLKQYSTSFALYNGYALAEHGRGNKDAAKTVLASATDLASKTSSSTFTEELRLWRTWSWVELESGAQNLAVKRLCSSVDDSLRTTADKDTTISLTYLLKAQQFFQGGFQHLCSIGDADGAEMRAESLALLAYLTADGSTEPKSSTQGNISAAMLSIGSSIKELRTRDHGGSTAHERLVQFAVRLLFLHAGRGPYRRDYLREQLSSWIGDFPRNTILLSMLEWSDSGLRVVDETRSLLYDRVLVKPHDCISSRVFTIEHEILRGNPNTTKVAYERAVTSEVAKNNVRIWIGYIRFCYEQHNMRPQAKDVFYRALRHCPWSKDVMMEAFGTLIRIMESEELKSIFAMMTSKGLRVHVDMDDFLEARRAESSGRRAKG